MGAAPPLPAAEPSLSVDHMLGRGRLRGTVAMLGPAFVAAVAYVDPGNFATNFAAGCSTATPWSGCWSPPT